MVEFAHGAVMAVVAVHLPNERGDLLVAAAAFGVIGAVLTDRACSGKAGSSARIHHRSGDWLVFHRESGDVHTFGWGPCSHTPKPLNGLLK